MEKQTEANRARGEDSEDDKNNGSSAGRAKNAHDGVAGGAGAAATAVRARRANAGQTANGKTIVRQNASNIHPIVWGDQRRSGRF